MKLYMHQKVFSWKDRFSVFDVEETPIYHVSGELFSWGKKLHVYNLNEEEVAGVNEKVMTLLPKFSVLVRGEEIAEIVKEFTLFRPSYAIRGINWKIKGDYFAHDYKITDGNRTVAAIHKKWLSFGDVYEVDIADEEEELYALAVVLAIDTVLAASETAALV